jgi:hypothetical protein
MKGVMIGGSDSIAQRRSGAQGLNGCFLRNSLLANTTLILLRDVRGIIVLLRRGRKLLRGETHRYVLPELGKTLAHWRLKQGAQERNRNIKLLARCRLRNRGTSRK